MENVLLFEAMLLRVSSLEQAFFLSLMFSLLASDLDFFFFKDLRFHSESTLTVLYRRLVVKRELGR